MQQNHSHNDDDNQEPQFSSNPQHFRFKEDHQQPSNNPKLFEPQIPLDPKAYTCLNSLKHGGTAESMFIPGEDPADFFSLLNDFFADYKPGTTANAAIVTDYTRARWILWRRQRSNSFYEFATYSRTPRNGIFTDRDLHDIQLSDRYLTTAERAFQRALKNVEAIRKDAVNDERWRQQLDLKIKQFDLDTRKFDIVQKRADREAAQQAIAQHDEAEASAAAAPRKRHEPIVLHNKRWLIRQAACIQEAHGNTHIVSLSPSNDEVRQMIENQDRYINPPVGVFRSFDFATGLVPADYAWLLKDFVPQARHAETWNPPLGCTLSFSRWQEMADIEATILFHQAQAEDPPKAA